MDKVKQERLVKEELMSQDDEEDIPVTEREMNLKVTIYLSAILTLTNFSDFKEIVNLIFLKNTQVYCFRVSHQTGIWICSEKPKQGPAR